ncbi:LacI family DNA-binding transcriptional regulator [Hymenobacter sp. BT188]|uniref:LacI family DNA-binding transcriptional regulator n=1 Tax=Hymenobacter sp. BT188 TaxID=2763504 RepID=UPI001651A5AB|nr:LacI family DNA-binding transcriptional regulator [Hymenobacter sp. BT188]MBC6608847.1 LacI family DNA-binding transcriptional regulator [Hymenobacter sp. BT188]
MEPVNLKRLAQELKLSVATVSRALNNSSSTSPATKARVVAMASKLKYEPNPHASSLRRHTSKTIGVILPEVANPFFSLVVNGIEEVARDQNYHVLLYLTHDNYEREVAITRLLVGGRIDGVLMSVASASQDFTHLDLLRERNIPTVFFDRVYDGLHTAQVTTDNCDSSYAATGHLIDNGCRTIAHLAVSNSLYIGRARTRGYAAALHDNRIPFDDELVRYAQPSQRQDVAMIQGLLQRRPDIDGIFASVESLAMSSYEACQNLGLSIVTAIKIIAFSNLEIATFLSPPLTTITNQRTLWAKPPPGYCLTQSWKTRRFQPATAWN